MGADLGIAETLFELAQVDHVLGCLRERDDLRFARRPDKAMLFCLREPQEMAADRQVITHPEVEVRVSQDASANPTSLACSRV